MIKSVFKQCFQYKLNTYILPTNEYLKKYKVADSDTCLRCNLERDTIIHRLWECEKVVPFLRQILTNLNNLEITREELRVEEFLFGTDGLGVQGVNHFILECKIFLFYDYEWKDPVNVNVDKFYRSIKRTIIKEKEIARGKTRYDKFENKWKNFTSIYDFRGPDPQMYV